MIINEFINQSIIKINKKLIYKTIKLSINKSKSNIFNNDEYEFILQFNKFILKKLRKKNSQNINKLLDKIDFKFITLSNTLVFIIFINFKSSKPLKPCYKY